jgi:hypothetical protein
LGYFITLLGGVSTFLELELTLSGDNREDRSYKPLEGVLTRRSLELFSVAATRLLASTADLLAEEVVLLVVVGLAAVPLLLRVVGGGNLLLRLGG